MVCFVCTCFVSESVKNLKFAPHNYLGIYQFPILMKKILFICFKLVISVLASIDPYN